VVNAGEIESAGVTAGSGVYFGQGGLLTNQAGALITSSLTSVSLKSTAGTVTNFGAIIGATAGTAGEAVYLNAGGMVTNYGVISGARNGNTTNGYLGAVEFHNTAGTVLNLGTITSPNDSNGVNLLPGGS